LKTANLLQDNLLQCRACPQFRVSLHRAVKRGKQAQSHAISKE
jgi:hypothetical protein